MLEYLNIAFTFANAVDLMLELMLSQLVDRDGGKYHIIKSECAEEEQIKRKKTKQEKKAEREKKV